MMVEEHFQSHFLAPFPIFAIWKGKYLEEMMLEIVRHVKSNTPEVRNVFITI